MIVGKYVEIIYFDPNIQEYRYYPNIWKVIKRKGKYVDLKNDKIKKVNIFNIEERKLNLLSTEC